MSRFYIRFNPEKLSTVSALAVQFFGKEDTLNRLLKERYEADLNDILLAPQGNPEVPPHQETDAMVPAGLDEGSATSEADDTSKWEATMSSMDSTITKAEISSGANLSAIVKATSKALKAALQENQELKILNQELYAQLEHRYLKTILTNASKFPARRQLFGFLFGAGTSCLEMLKYVQRKLRRYMLPLYRFSVNAEISQKLALRPYYY